MIENKINGKIYIGQTIRPIQKRLKEHKKGKIGCRAIYNAIKKYGWQNFKKDWYDCPDEDLNFDEDLMVQEMKTLSPNGYNLKEGGGNGKLSEETKQRIGEANRGRSHTEESRQKMSESQLGRTHDDKTKQKIGDVQRGISKSEDHRQHISEARLGISLSDKTRQKIGDANRGRTCTEETRQKMSEAKLGHVVSEKTRQKISDSKKGEKNPRSKKVYQYDQEGNYICSFGSCREAARHLEKGNSVISECANGTTKIAHGFKWSYEGPM